ncbi:MAG TPA: hypothetical protein VMX17_11525 [Candidatus Glassbacteria bacterium]|nr:hypothetical protein [Candidatus Glassbacteria bacterium]
MMNVKDLAKKLRMILYQNDDCETLTTEFERVLKLCDCEYEAKIIEDDKTIIIDLSPYIQYIKIKRSPKRIYEIRLEDESIIMRR